MVETMNYSAGMVSQVFAFVETKQTAELMVVGMSTNQHQRIEIDLDDGVKVNYAKFQCVEVAQEGEKALKVDLLAKI